MGVILSPYLVIKEMFIIKDRVRGARLGLDNFFQWDKVIMNLPVWIIIIQVDFGYLK